jgi:hypothetical protein
MKTLLLTFALCSFLLGQTQTIDDTGVPNGRFWRTMNPREKVIYLTGLSQGIDITTVIAAMHTPEIMAVVKDAIPAGFALGDYQRELDTLYGDTENVLINLKIAWILCNNKLKGKYTKEVLERSLINARQEAAGRYTGK